MAKLTVLIVEDEALYADQLEMQIEEMGYASVGIASNALDALTLFHTASPDLILMDINLAGDTDGIQLAQKIQDTRETPIIFITSLTDNKTFERAVQTLPIAYLEKPLGKRKLQRTIELIVSRLNLKEEEPFDAWEQDILVKDQFFIKVRNRLEKVEIRAIDYVEVENRYCSLFTAQRKYVVRMALKDLIHRLPQDLFIQTHRSFMVNMKKINSLDLGESVLYIGEKGLPLGKSYREQVMKKLNFLA